MSIRGIIRITMRCRWRQHREHLQAYRIVYQMPDVAHTFRAGHRIMVQIQSSWFPLTDRNPQKFMDIPKALSTDFTKATERLYTGGSEASHIGIPVVE